jgi:E3 ubiquitin-protein ligase DOA10
MSKMRKLLRNKKAITPVLSNVLMMLIAVAGMSIAITATYVISTNFHDTMGERFIVEDVWFRPGGISIYLRNTGKVALRFTSVYVNHISQSFASLDVEVSRHAWLNITYAWTAGSVYNINIATSRGTQVADYYKAPA